MSNSYLVVDTPKREKAAETVAFKRDLGSRSISERRHSEKVMYSVQITERAITTFTMILHAC